MINFIKFLLAMLLTLLIFCCKESPDDTTSPSKDTNTQNSMTLNFEFGEGNGSNANNIYVIWIENETENFLQNIFICDKLISGGLQGTALPYWKINKYPNSLESEIDAVTAATIRNRDFTVPITLTNNSIRSFTIYFEIDHSWDSNDWFNDQPAILYSADINLDNSSTEYELSHIGWTPDENTDNIIDNTPRGVFQSETRDITHLKDGTGFGSEDQSRSATRIVDKITLTIN